MAVSSNSSLILFSCSTASCLALVVSSLNLFNAFLVLKPSTPSCHAPKIPCIFSTSLFMNIHLTNTLSSIFFISFSNGAIAFALKLLVLFYNFILLINSCTPAYAFAILSSSILIFSCIPSSNEHLLDSNLLILSSALGNN